MNNILATFKYNGKEYVYYLYYNVIKYGYYDSNKNICNVDNEIEKRILDIALYKISISSNRKNHIKLNTIFYNGKKFQKFYDKVSGLIFFYEIINNKYRLPSIGDITYLMDKFNISSYYNKFKGINRKIKKSLTIGGIATTIVVSTGLLFYSKIESKEFDNTTAVGNNPYFLTDEEIERITEESNDRWHYLGDDDIRDEIPYSLDKIVESLNRNQNLNDSEKQFILSYKKVFEENSEFINMNRLMDTLSNLKINYVPSDYQYAEYSADPYAYEINAYGYDDFQAIDKDLLTHEIFHGFTAYLDNSMGYGLMEGLTEIMRSEYSNTQAVTYSEQRTCIHLLSHIIGVEPLKKFYFSGDINYIKDSLKLIINDEEKVIALINGIDDICNQIYSSINNEDIFVNCNEAGSVEQLMGEFFEAKYGYGINDDNECRLLINQIKSDFISFDASVKVNEEDIYCSDIFDITYKGLFSNNYIQNNPNYVLEVKRTDENGDKYIERISIIEELVNVQTK